MVTCVGASPYNPDEPGRFSAPPLDGSTGDEAQNQVGASPYDPDEAGSFSPPLDGSIGDEANLPASGAEPGPYLDVESGMIGVNEIVPPYVEVDSTGILVKGDETEIIHL